MSSIEEFIFADPFLSIHTDIVLSRISSVRLDIVAFIWSVSVNPRECSVGLAPCKIQRLAPRGLVAYHPLGKKKIEGNSRQAIGPA